MIDLNLQTKRMDWWIVVAVLVLLVFSLLAVYSATYGSPSETMRLNFQRQVVWILLGLLLATIMSLIPTSWFRSLAFGAYGILLVLLLVLLVVGDDVGSRRWLTLGQIAVQPSEFMKPVLVLTLARFLSDREGDPNLPRILFTAFGLAMLPFLLVIQQPDLGTALTYLIITIPMLYWRGLKMFVIFVICAPFITFIASFNYWTFFFVMLTISVILVAARRGALVFWSVFVLNIVVGILAPQVWGHLHSYQQQRILTFLGLVSDPQGAGYQIIQSKVAIGSGGFWGRGILQGTQTQLRFLPAQHTDFIFSVLAEELGFLGSLVILSAFFLFLIRGVSVAASTKNPFASLVAVGLVSIFAFHVVVNIGMTVGVMPVTGLPLPLISYGGSSMVTSLIMVGMILNVSVKRFHYYRV